MEFNKRFQNLYNRIPMDIRPSQVAAKVTYVAAHDPDFTMMLRERRSTTLDNMHNDVVDIESNMAASGKRKLKSNNAEKKKQKEDPPAQASS